MTDLNLSDLKYSYTNKNKDLKISYNKDGVQGSITLKNFASKDVTNNATKKTADTSSAELIANGEKLNLKEDLQLVGNSKIEVNAKFTGSRFDEEIDGSSYTLYTDKKKTIVQTNTAKTGLTIKGGAGDDIITGSNYSDKLYGNAGDDTINGGTGNNLIYLNKGDGHDVIENGNGVDTLVFAKGTKITTKFQGNDLVISYGNAGDTVTLKDFKDGHSVQYIKIGSSKKAIDTYYPQAETLKIGNVNFVEGTDEPNNIVVKTTGTNRIFGGFGNDTIKTDNSYTTNYIYGGEGDDTIISGAGTDIINGGGGNNKILFSKGSGTDYFYEDNVNNTLVFDTVSFTTDNDGKVTGLGNLKIEKTPGFSMGYYSNCNLKISGYGTTKNGVEDAVYIQNYFNLTDYDFSGYKLQDKNGKTIDINDAVSMADGNTLFYTSFNRNYWATDASETIYVKTENEGNYTPNTYGNVTYTNSRGGNDTIYSGGIYLSSENTSGNPFFRALISAGDGDNVIHAEGNKIYFTTELTNLNYKKADYEKQLKTSVPDVYGNNIDTTTTVYNADHIYITPQKDVMTGFFFYIYKGEKDEDGDLIITEFEKVKDTSKYYLYATDTAQDYEGKELTRYIYHAENLLDCEIAGKKTYVIDYGDKVTSGQLATFMYGSPGITTGDGNNTVYMGNGSWLSAGAGDDTVYGDGTIETGGGNDRIFLSDDNLYAGGLGFTYYNVDAQGGNDYIDLTDVKGSSADRVHVIEMSSGTRVYGAEGVEYNHSEGVDTMVINPESDVPVDIRLWPTTRTGSGTWNNRDGYFNHSNVNNNYTAFQRGDDLVIANGNGVSPSTGTLIIKDYYAYKKDEKGEFILGGKGNKIPVFSEERKSNIYLWFDPSFRQEGDYFLGTTQMTLDEFVEHVGLTDYYEWNVEHKDNPTDIRQTRENNLWFEVINNADAKNPLTTINTPTLYQKEELKKWNYDTLQYDYINNNIARGKYILGGKGSQTIYGGDGDDVIYGDDIYGHDENGNYKKSTDTKGDKIYGGKGN
ncbi:calcium-binding protein, partial [bacterium]|nr:calcium-binding protein [bacterium]